MPDEPSDSDPLRQLVRANLTEVMAALSPRERAVLRLRFGLDDGRPQTLAQVAALYGITEQRVRQIEAQAFRKLRPPGPPRPPRPAAVAGRPRPPFFADYSPRARSRPRTQQD
jgi:DNA-directed RNA polymerase sigma subunit (sigma70/sigma32)